MGQKFEIGFVEKLDITSIVKDVLRQWWVILMLSISVSLFADIWMVENYVPQYQTTTTLAVTAKGLNNNIYQNLTTAKDLAGRFSQIVNSNVMKRKVAEELGDKEFEAYMTVSQVPETNLLEFTVTANSAMKAYHTLDVVLNNYNSVSDYAIENVILETVQASEIPTKPLNPFSEVKIMVMSFLASGLLFTLFFATLSYFRDTVKNSSDFNRKIDARLLGIIYNEKKKKPLFGRKKKSWKSMLILNPLRSFQFVESNKMVASKIRSYLDKEEKKLILITSVMEDEGKSTIAANLAVALAMENKEVLLIDCDFRKPSQYKIFDAAESEIVNLPEILKSNEEPLNVFKSEKDGIYKIFNKISSSHVTDIVEHEKLKNVLDHYRELMDYVIIDTSPMALVSDAEELAQIADASILVVRRDVVHTRYINDTIDVLNNTRAKVLGCIFNDAVTGTVSERSSYGRGNYYGYGGHYEKGER